MQQKLLAHYAQLEFAQGAGGSKVQDALLADANLRINQAEQMERKGRRKAAKIAQMVRDPQASFLD